MNDVTSFVSAIGAHWARATQSILDAAKSCHLANESLNSAEKLELRNRLSISSSTFSKLVAIGGDRRMVRTDLRARLPVSFSIIYELTKLNDCEMESALRDDCISPKMSRNAAIMMRKKSTELPSGSESAITGAAPPLLPVCSPSRVASDELYNKSYDELVQSNISRAERGGASESLKSSPSGHDDPYNEVLALVRAKQASRSLSQDDFLSELVALANSHEFEVEVFTDWRPKAP